MCELELGVHSGHYLAISGLPQGRGWVELQLCEAPSLQDFRRWQSGQVHSDGFTVAASAK